jgi:hypothetical protein
MQGDRVEAEAVSTIRCRTHSEATCRRRKDEAGGRSQLWFTQASNTHAKCTGRTRRTCRTQGTRRARRTCRWYNAKCRMLNAGEGDKIYSPIGEIRDKGRKRFKVHNGRAPLGPCVRSDISTTRLDIHFSTIRPFEHLLQATYTDCPSRRFSTFESLDP